MTDNQLTTISAALETLRRKRGGDQVIDPENRWCLTLEARDPSTIGEPFWIQIQAGTLNMQYLDEDDPVCRLTAEVPDFPPSFRLIAWEPCLYATFDLAPEFSPGLSGLFDRIIRQYFGLSKNYQISTEFFQLDPPA